MFVVGFIDLILPIASLLIFRIGVDRDYVKSANYNVYISRCL